MASTQVVKVMVRSQKTLSVMKAVANQRNLITPQVKSNIKTKFKPLVSISYKVVMKRTKNIMQTALETGTQN